MKDLSNLLGEIRATSKPSEKCAIIKDYDSDFTRYLIEMAYNPFKVFNVKLTKKEIPSPGNKSLSDMSEKVMEILDFCEESKSPKQNREAVIPILEDLNSGSQDLLLGTLDKNWKCGLGVKNLLKTFPNIVPVFEVQLANKYEDSKKKKSFVKKPRLCSYKLDGVRCIALRKDGEWEFFTRQGKKLLTLDHLKDNLEAIYNDVGYTFFDGEAYKHGIPFNEIQGMVMGFTQGTAYDLDFNVFAMGYMQDFLAQDASRVVVPDQETTAGLRYVTALDQHIVEDEDVYEELDKAFAEGYEGIMLRDPDILYDYKRSDAILKVKEALKGDNIGEQFADCTVVDYLLDDFPVIEDGVMVTKTLITKLWVRQHTYNDLICKVGSGYDLKFRYHYSKDPDNLIVGKIVEIKFQDYGSKGLMRFPRLHKVREDL
jgi:DNA ligase 1